MSQIVLGKVSKVFDGNVEAVCEISLEVSAGQTLVLAGPSGAGKSTLLRLIAGLETPTAGTISMDGQVVNNIEPRDRNIAMVFQHFALYPHMTVFENMGFALKMAGESKAIIRQKVIDAANMLEIEPLLKRKPAQLSGGERQRAALGKAIVRQPRVFLFDEPLSNLDPMLRAAARTQIKDILTKLNATAVYVTHDRHEAKALGDEVAILREGRLQQIGAYDEIMQKPVNEFVERFMRED